MQLFVEEVVVTGGEVGGKDMGLQVLGVFY